MRHLFFHSPALLRALAATAVLSTVAACGQPPQGPISLPREAPSTIRIFQSEEMFSRNPELYSCDGFQQAYLDRGWPTGDSISVIKKIDRMVRSRFRYRRDRGDKWDAHPEVLLQSKSTLKGDCDDQAATTVAMALCAGVPRDKLGFVITSPDFDNISTTENHILGFYRDDDGNFWRLGDTKYAVTPLNKGLGRISHWMYLDAPHHWVVNDPANPVPIHLPTVAYEPQL